MFDLAAFDSAITRQNRQSGARDDILLSNALRQPKEEAGIKHLGATSIMVVSALFLAVQSGPALFGGATQPSASLDPSALETYAMHLDAPQVHHDLISLFDSTNRS